MKSIKKILAVLCVLVLAVSFTMLSRDSKLKASDGDGTSTASEQQEKKADKPVEVSVPEKKAEPKEEKQPEPEKKAEPKEEKQPEPEKKAEPEVKEEKKAEQEPEVKVEEKQPEPEVKAEEKQPEPETKKEEPEQEPEKTEPAEEAKPDYSNVRVTCEIKNKGTIYFGDEVTLKAKVNGLGTSKYTLNWQVNKGDKEGWQDIPGEHGKTYKFIVDEENNEYQYRVVACTED